MVRLRCESRFVPISPTADALRGRVDTEIRRVRAVRGLPLHSREAARTAGTASERLERVAMASGDEANDEEGQTPEFILGALAAGGAFLRLIAAMGELGIAAEAAPTAAGLAECAVECTMEVGGIEGFVP